MKDRSQLVSYLAREEIECEVVYKKKKKKEIECEELEA